MPNDEPARAGAEFPIEYDNGSSTLNLTIGQKYHYLSIPYCCDICNIKILSGRFVEPDRLYGMICFDETYRSLYEEKIKRIAALVRSWPTAINDQSTSGFWIHTPTACRLLELSVSTQQAANNYESNCFADREDAQILTNRILEILFT